MKRFRNILLVANKATGNGTLSMAFNRAAALAKRNQAKLKVVDVLEELPSETSSLYKTVPRSELREMLIEHRLSALDTLVAPLREEGHAGRYKSPRRNTVR